MASDHFSPEELNLGLTQAELKAMDFEQITTKLRQNFAGAGGVALDSYAGSMAKLSVATSNASETIGTALLDAIIKISGSNGVDGLISKIDTLASAFASVVTQVGNAVAALTGTAAQKAFSPGYYVSGGKAGGRTVGPTGAGNMALSVLSQDTQKSDLAAKKKAELDAIKRNKELAALAKSQAKSAADQLKAKRDQAALDKAALVLGKGQDVFNMDAIQIQAALLSKQDEINKLGATATDQQKLQLANDLVRLTVKQDILKLEDAIAAKDVEGATALASKLNKDLMILGTLQGQAVKLADINNILNSFKPKDLINLENLNQALALLMAMAGVKISPQTVAQVSGGGGGGGGSGFDLTSIPKLPHLTGTESIDAIIEVADAVATLNNSIADEIDARNAAAAKALDEGILGKIVAAATAAALEANKERYGNAGGGPVVTIIDKTSGLIEVVQTAVQENNRFGNNLSYAGAI